MKGEKGRKKGKKKPTEGDRHAVTYKSKRVYVVRLWDMRRDPDLMVRNPKEVTRGQARCYKDTNNRMK